MFSEIAILWLRLVIRNFTGVICLTYLKKSKKATLKVNFLWTTLQVNTVPTNMIGVSNGKGISSEEYVHAAEWDQQFLI